MKNGHSTFSALEYSKELKAVGFSQEQAELQARQFELMRHEIESNLASKKDTEQIRKDIEILATKMATKQDISNMATKQDISNMATKQDVVEIGSALTMRVLVIVGFFVTVMGVLIKVL